MTKRAAFHVRAELGDLQYLVLEKLRHRRNTGVHEGVFPEDAGCPRRKPLALSEVGATSVKRYVKYY